MTSSVTRNDQRRRGRHQAVGDDAVGEGVARCAEDRERGHVRAEQRQQEHGRAERAAGEKVVFGVRGAALRAEREDADVEHDRQVREDDRGRNHSSARRSGSRCDGQSMPDERDEDAAEVASV